jgi:hypothetical protein
MKSIAIVAAALALTGCATPEQNILAGAAIGAIIGSEVSRQQTNPQPQRPVIIHQPAPVIIHRPAPVIIHQPRPYPRHCDYYPQYDRWGNYRGDRQICR